MNAQAEQFTTDAAAIIEQLVKACKNHAASRAELVKALDATVKFAVTRLIKAQDCGVINTIPAVLKNNGAEKWCNPVFTDLVAYLKAAGLPMEAIIPATRALQFLCKAKDLKKWTDSGNNMNEALAYIENISFSTFRQMEKPKKDINAFAKARQQADALQKTIEGYGLQTDPTWQAVLDAVKTITGK